MVKENSALAELRKLLEERAKLDERIDAKREEVRAEFDRRQRELMDEMTEAGLDPVPAKSARGRKAPDSASGRQVICKICGKPGHNARRHGGEGKASAK